MKEIVLIAQVNENNNRVQLQQFYVVCSKKSIRDKDMIFHDKRVSWKRHPVWPGRDHLPRPI